MLNLNLDHGRPHFTNLVPLCMKWNTLCFTKYTLKFHKQNCLYLSYFLLSLLSCSVGQELVGNTEALALMLRQ